MPNIDYIGRRRGYRTGAMLPARRIVVTQCVSPKPRSFLRMLAPFVVTLVIAPAAAAPLPRLVVARSPDATDCPDATELALAVERQMQRPALDPTNDAHTAAVYDVRIEHSADGYAATIQADNLTRNLSDPGSTCTGLGEALALTLAILLDNEPSKPPSSPTPPLSAPPALPRRTPTTMIAFIVKPIQHWNMGTEGGIGETLGFLSPLSFAVTLDVWFRYRAVSIGSGIFFVPSAIENGKQATSVALQLITGDLYACGRVAGKPSGTNFSLCGQTFVGVVHGEGRGYSVNREGTRPWFALGTMGSLQGVVVGSLGWFLRLSVAVPVVSQRFTAHEIDGTGINTRDNIVTLFDPAPVAVFLGAGLRWTIY